MPLKAATLPNCQPVKNAVSILHHVAFSSTSLLFFFCVRAIFLQKKIVVACFFVLWSGVLGASIAVTPSGKVAHLEPTQYCKETALKPSASVAPIMLAVNDTFVFLAISWRLLSGVQLEPPTPEKKSLLGMVLGNYISDFSRKLLQDGQIYYLVTVTSNIINAVINCTHAVPIAYRLMFTIFNVVLANIMACRVYRHTKFGDSSEKTISTRWLSAQMNRFDPENGLVPIRFTPAHQGQAMDYDSATEVAHEMGPIVTQKISLVVDDATGEALHAEGLIASTSGQSQTATTSHE
ncbi:hypothetical protein H0H81_005232 [Sphagnurus paluster]|uniref:Uncharacterized protein n=1 Tax=Sphagnurus paluster TaxID=117069 RepID=A0A9P7GN90_9AGAR|nr:hypothetical protein H0H81_005232 [Sphagnurus paluster]